MTAIVLSTTLYSRTTEYILFMSFKKKILLLFLQKLNFFNLLRKRKRRDILRSRKLFFVLNFILLFLLVVSIGANQFIIAQTQNELGIDGIFFDQFVKDGKTDLNSLTDKGLTGNLVEDSVKLVISQGVPDLYGKELGISFDEVQQSINIMKQYDPTYGKQKIVLSSDDLSRYIDVGLRISCEYCCGAKAIIRQDGRAACGCAHSQAMRGLLAYLIKNHGDQYTNDELLRELARWKGMFFPKQMIKKLSMQLQGSEEFTPDTASLLLNVKLPEYGQGSGEAPLPSEIKDLPSMVGGC